MFLYGFDKEHREVVRAELKFDNDTGIGKRQNASIIEIANGLMNVLKDRFKNIQNFYLVDEEVGCEKHKSHFWVDGWQATTVTECHRIVYDEREMYEYGGILVKPTHKV